MLPLLKAEYRKLSTIRSTYIMLGVAALLVGFIAFWVMGYRGNAGSTSLLLDSAKSAAQTVPVFLALIAVLLITHEYRYNTIMYTLTSSNSRQKVLAAKAVVLLAMGVVVTLAFMVFGALMTWIGVLASGHPLAVQYFYLWDATWQGLFYSLAWISCGLLFGLLFRHVVGAIITLFVVPSTVEGLLTLLLKDNGKYLPFTALEQVVNAGPLAPGKAALIFTIYIVVGGFVGWYLFLKRDAN